MAKDNVKKGSNKGSDKGSKGAAKAAPAAVEPETTETAEAAGPEGSQLGTLAALPLRLVDATSFRNRRTGDFTIGDSSEDGTNQSFKELAESIEAVGQKDPITVRRKAAGLVDNGMPYEVIKGFRRFAVVNLLAQRAGTEDTATVNAIIKDLTDLQAVEENIFENTARDNLTGPDLAWAAFDLQEQYKANGLPFSGNVVAKKLGKNQTYIAKLLRIVTGAPVVAKSWQESQSPLTSDAMDRIAKLDPDKQVAEYERINAVLKGKAGKSGGATNPPIVAAQKRAVRLATLLGNLVSQGLITVDINWEANLSHIGVKTSDLTVQDIRAVAKAAIEAFEAAKAPKPAAQAAANAAATENEADAETAEAAAN